MRRPFRHQRSHQAIKALLIPLLLVTACDSSTEPVDSAESVRVLPQALLIAGSPVTCASIRAAQGSLADGNYALRTTEGNTFVAWCHQMSSSAPTSFLTIPQNGVDQNYTTWSGSRDLITRYSKVRLDVATMRVSTTDMTFAASFNAPVFGPGVNLYSMPFARPSDCRAPGSRTGRGNVDLNGTPFALNAYFTAEGWYPNGTVNGRTVGWGERYLVTAKRAVLTGGGHCGSLTNWTAGDPDYDHPWLQLRWDGASLPSPAVSVTGSASVIEGTAAALSATTSHPANVPFWTSYDLGDGTTGTGALPASHVYAQHGTYTVKVTAFDHATAPTTATHTVVVTNPPPVVAPIAAATIFEGETFAASGSFSDPVVESHSATVDYGAGAGALALSGSNFTLSHTFANAGVYTITVVVTDQDGFSGSGSTTVTVLSAAQASLAVATQIEAMLPANIADGLVDSLNGVAEALNAGNTTAARGKLGAFDNKTDALLNSRRIDSATHAKLKEFSGRIRASIK